MREDEKSSGPDGAPVLLPKGYAKFSARYDDRGNQTEMSFFGTDGKPILFKDGYARVVLRLDPRDRPVEETFFGTGGEPVLTREGYAKRQTHYNESGDPVEVSHLDLEDRLTPDRYGVARVTLEEIGRDTLEMIYWDKDGNRARHGGRGFAWMRLIIGDDFQLQDVIYFDLDGSKVRTRPVVTGLGPDGGTGLEVGDVLERINGERIADAARFKTRDLGAWEDGQPRDLQVLRAGKRLTLRVTRETLSEGVQLEDRVAPE